MDDYREKANIHLAIIAVQQARLNKQLTDMDAELANVKSRYQAAVDAAKADISESEKALEKLVKKHRKDVMDGADRVDLPAGSVLLKTERRVKRIKKMLAKLKAAGLKQAVKVAKEVVDWDQVEKFNDATLKRLGTKRQNKTIFSYELTRKGKSDG